MRLAAAIDATKCPGETLWVGLEGEMGAGKTTLTARLVPALRARGWQSEGGDEVASPTYAIEHHYLGGQVLHADLYRLTDARLPGLSLFDTQARLALVEWASRIAAVEEQLDLLLHLEALPRNGRLVTLIARTESGAALLRALDD